MNEIFVGITFEICPGCTVTVQARSVEEAKEAIYQWLQGREDYRIR